MRIETLEITKEIENKLLKRVSNHFKFKIKNRDLPVYLGQVIEKAIIHVKKHGKPEAGYCFLPILDINKNDIRTNAGSIKSKKITNLARCCQGDIFISFMISTLGLDFETFYKTEKFYNQFVFDIVGSECIQLVSDIFVNRFKAQTEMKHMESTYRFSPGYCDWELDGQKTIFTAIDSEKLNVKINEYYIMSPVKTISSITIISDMVPKKSPCDDCKKTGCVYRREEKIVVKEIHDNRLFT